jgi:two-component system response regulator (stage 0 sporulation protein A)
MDWYDVYKKELEKHNFNILLPATSGNEGIEAVKLNRPDVILLDLIMPHNDGISVVEYISENIDSYHPVIYVLSSLYTTAVISLVMEKIRECNAIGYYSKKTIDPVLLVKNLHRLLRFRNGFEG